MQRSMIWFRPKRYSCRYRGVFGESLEPRHLMASITMVDATSMLGTLPRRGTGALAGVAWFDFNNDGHRDLLMTHDESRQNRLYKNNGDGTLTDVTQSAGLAATGPSGAAVAGDIDNDSFVDLFIGGAGDDFQAIPNVLKLYRNNGDGTFADITVASKLVGPLTQGSAAMADVNGDGFLDLFISGIGSLTHEVQHPSKLFLNNRNLTFTDVTKSAGVKAELGACANGFSDYDLDGDQDLFVANCNEVFFAPTPIQLFRNDGTGHFADVTKESKLDRFGGFWMGIEFADFDNDGDFDFFATNLGSKLFPGDPDPHGFFENQGDGTFENVASSLGVANWEFGWGAAMTDFDNDGFADLAFAGTLGSVGSVSFSYLGTNRGNPGRFFFNNLGSENPSRQFIESSKDVLGVNLSNFYTSGVAYADMNQDGFQDLFILSQSRSSQVPIPPMLFVNSKNANHWLGVDLVGTASNRDAIGARVAVHVGPWRQVKELQAGTSFQSMHSTSLRFGLGQNTTVQVIHVVWPNGKNEFFNPPDSVDRVIRLVEGQGTPPTLGDLNFDGIASALDVDYLAEQIWLDKPIAADFNTDGQVDLADRTHLAKEIIQLRPGDSDLDQDVDSADLLTLLSNWTGSLQPGIGDAGWLKGDIDGDQDVDSNDLLEFLSSWTGDSPSG